jgi:hypothetical protein
VGSNPTPGTDVGADGDDAVMAHVRAPEVVASALAASDAGIPDAENALQHGVAVKTIRRWRRLYQRRGQPRGQQHLAPPCPRCDDGDLDGSAYAELLGWYLGDGYLSTGRRSVYNLHVYNDARYPVLNARVAELMRRVKAGGRPHTRLLPGAVVTTVSWKHWPCLFPQHGPGRKHTRPIVLQSWQEELVAQHPAALLRGLMHSDGCRCTNVVRRSSADGTRTYSYGRWMFTNSSEDILSICTRALDRLGVAWRRSRHNCVSVSRAEGVAVLDRLIGPKS